MQRVTLWVGLATLAGVWAGPLPELSRQAFWAHMTIHMAVVAVAAPLIAIGLAGTRLDPARLAPALVAPIPASIAELVIVWTWHTPAFHHAARAGAGAFALEQGMFLAAGLLLWSAAVGHDAGRHRRAAAGIVAMLFTSVHMTLLGSIFALTPRPLYHHAGTAGLSALTDQHLGGAIMLLVGGASYLAGAFWLLRKLLAARAN